MKNEDQALAHLMDDIKNHETRIYRDDEAPTSITGPFVMFAGLLRS